MLALLISYALAAEPQKFDAFPATVSVDGKSYTGLMVDEATVKELIALRAEAAELRTTVDAMQERLDEKESICVDTVYMLRDECESQIQEASRRTFVEKHGVAVGMSLGVTATVASILTAGFVIGEASSIATP